MPIIFKKTAGDASFEIEINSDTTVEDFRMIESAFKRLSERYSSALDEIEKERELALQELRDRNIKNNPCYYCVGFDFGDCQKACKGKATCADYQELPF